MTEAADTPDVVQAGSTWRFRILLTALIVVSAVVAGLIVARFQGDSGEQQAPVALVPATATETRVETPVPETPIATLPPTLAPTATLAPTVLPTATAEPTPVLVASNDSVVVLVFAAHGRLEDPDDEESTRIWLDTGIDLVGEPVILSADGSVTEQEGGAGWPPSGMNTNFCQDPVRPCVAPRLSRYALIGIVEGQPTPFLVGEGEAITATGRLYLAFNDGNFADNCLSDLPACGAWEVTIEGVFERSAAP